jgi:diguanylate cyclase (GGDEF)-like protein
VPRAINGSLFFAVIRRWTVAVQNLDWQRRDVTDALVLIGVLVVVFFLSDIYSLPPKLFQFALDNADWEIDDVLFVVTTLSVALLIYVNRRRQDLAKEIKARQAAEFESHRLARHDPLTGLPNRRFFAERLNEILQQGTLENHRTGVLMLDLDGFKAVNDMHGHRAGDEALVEFAGRLSAVLRSGSFVARVGGDEFAIVMKKVELAEAGRLAHRIVTTLAKPFSVGGVSVTLGVGVGIAVAPDDGTTPEDLVRRADMALYRAKAEGRSLVRFFEPEMDKHMKRRALIERELREAIAADNVAVHYQPLVNIEGSQIIGFEALARWISPSLGTISPQEFIMVAEECGLIAELGDRLLRIACREAVQWPADLTLSVNLSPIQLRDTALGLRILSILGETGFNPRRLEVEITESALVSDADVAKSVIDDLRAAGVRIALDDFGTGYATMSQLLALRFDKIKIDRSFIDQLGQDPQSDVIVRATIGLAKGLNLVSTAEGIETADQLATLRADGCIQGQGYFFGRAVPANEIPTLLRHSRELLAVA